MAKEHLYEALFEKQNGLCAICEGELPDRFHTHIDRITPGKEGGKYVVENCQLICMTCDWAKEGNAPNSVFPQVAAAYREYKFWQLEEGRHARRIKAMSGDLQNTSRSPYFTAYLLDEMTAFRDVFADRKKASEKRIKDLIKDIPAAQLICDAWGGGTMLAAHIISRFDISKAKHVSSMWKFFGFDPTEKYNPGKGKDLKSPLYAALSISLIRKSGPYRADYDEMREKELGHGQSIHRLIKRWLSHLWVSWRKMEGLQVTLPYACNHLEHAYKPPSEYGWPE